MQHVFTPEESALMRTSPRSTLLLAMLTLLLSLAHLSSQAQTQAKRSYDLLHSVGVNTHAWYDWEKAKAAIIELGIKEIRDIRPPVSEVQYLYNNYGVRLTYCIGHGGETADMNSVRQWINDYGPEKIVAVTGRNEIDIFDGSPDKWNKARTEQQALWNLIKGTPAFSNIAVGTVSLGNPWSGSANNVGDLTQWCDYGDVHHYYGGTHPEATTDWNISNHRAMIGDKPVLCTESGYHNAYWQHDGHKGTSETAEAKYVIRQYLYKWMTNYQGTNWFAKTFDYELLDEGTGPDQEQLFGWVRNDGSRKPAFYAMKNFLSLIADNNGSFTPQSLNYSFSGDMTNIKHLLVQKSDGKFLLFVWQGISTWNQDTGDEWTNPTRSLNLTLNGVTASSIRSFLPATSANVQQSWPNTSSITLSVPDHPLVLEISLQTCQGKTCYLPAEMPGAVVNGLKYRYYEGHWNQLPAFYNLSPARQGIVANLDLSKKKRNDYFGFQYTGYVDVPTDGEYTFYLNSEDGSRLYIGNQLVVDNNGVHAAREKQGKILLRAGKHSLTVEYFQRTGGSALSLAYSGPGLSKRPVPASALYRPDDLRQGENPANLVAGVDYTYHEGNWSSLPTFDTVALVRDGILPNFQLGSQLRANHIAFRYTAYVDIAREGDYTFYVKSDDGSRLYIGNLPVVSNDGMHLSREMSGEIGLKPGKHAITVEYFNRSGSYDLEVSYSGPSLSKQRIPDGVLYRPNRPYLPAVTPTNLTDGIDYTYYEGEWNSLPAFSTLTPVAAGNQASIDASGKQREDNFAFRFTGFIKVPLDGTYTFYTDADDGVQLLIGDSLVIDNNGVHDPEEHSAQIRLKAGYHPLTVNYFEAGPGGVLLVSYSGPGIGKQSLPANLLFRTNSPRSADNPARTVNGVEYAYYQFSPSLGSFSQARMPTFTKLIPHKAGVQASLDLSRKTDNDRFGFRFMGYVEVPAEGEYTFYTDSDDGSRLYIGNTLVVDNSGLHRRREQSGKISLKAGKHAFKVEYFENKGSEHLSVSYSGPGVAKQVIPASALYRLDLSDLSGTVLANLATGAMKVDGVLNEGDWQITTPVSKRTVGDTTNNQVSYGLLWDQTYLYVGVRVLDSSLNYNHDRGEWDNDAVEIYVDANNNKGAAYDSQDRQFLKAYNTDYIWEQHAHTAGVQQAWSLIEGGYSMEVAIPWSNLGISPSPNLAIGFDLGNDDDDSNAGRESQMMWNGQGINFFNTQGFGTAILRLTAPPTAPTVSLTTPTNNATYLAPAYFWLRAAASDADGTISKVEFYNGTHLLHTEYVTPYGFKVRDLPVGNYTFTAKAYDNGGLVTTSAPVHISVVPNKPPVVSIIRPVVKQTVAAPGYIHFQAAASDSDGRITNVKFYNGSTLLRTEYKYPYTYVWKDVPEGTYTITAVATDNWGAQTTSAPVTVRVTSPNTPIVSSRPTDNKKGIMGTIDIKVAPNPATNAVNIYMNGLQQNRTVTISVISVSGIVMKTMKTMKTMKINNSIQTIQLDVSSLVRGAYTIKITSGDKTAYKQFVKL